MNNASKTAKYDIEHALNMYADSFVILPAEFLYESEKLEEHKDVISKCHIYMIGFVPKIDLDCACEAERILTLKYNVHNEKIEIKLPIPDHINLKIDDEYYYFEDEKTPDSRFWFDDNSMQKMLHDHGKSIEFNIKYIGQAFGSDGSRNAIDWLLKHETLQKIAIKGIPDGYRLSLLLLEIQPENRLLTVFNPHSHIKDEHGTRIQAGIDKLNNTTEAERISLYEAALIRYFSPEFNKEFKNSFPSTNLKILQDCYEKDISAVIAEICIDEFPFYLCSETVSPLKYHISKHDLHKEEDRKIFFCK